jgi:prepilin-type N-terminal cleavage/methylation domain-containing protein
MRHTKFQTGFSLIEMMIAMAITLMIVASVFQYLKQNLDIFAVEAANADLHQNFRASIDLLTRDIQAAGAGIPRFLGPIACKDGGTTDPVNGTPQMIAGRPIPDEIFILYGDPDFVPVSVNNSSNGLPLPTSPNAVIDVAGTNFTTGEFYIIYSGSLNQSFNSVTPDDGRFSIFRVDSVDSIVGKPSERRLTTSALTVSVPVPDNWPNMEFPSGTSRVTKLDEFIHYRLNVNTNELERSVNGGEFIAVARHIRDLQFRYWIEWLNNDGVTFSSNWVDQVGATTDASGDLTNQDNRGLIRGIEFFIEGEVVGREIAGQSQRRISQRLEVTPRNLVLTGLTPNR